MPNDRRVLFLAANPSISPVTGGPVGFWWAELTHPYEVFARAGYEVDFCSPDGGPIVADAWSDPAHPSGYAADDFVSLGFARSATHAARLVDTARVEDVDVDRYAAIFVIGGQSPMVTFPGDARIGALLARFWDAGKPTALVCHGTCALLEGEGARIARGRTWTGFANSEEDAADAAVGRPIQPFRIEDRARATEGTRFVVAGAFRPFAVRDGNLITGQQQHSGRAAAELVLEALGSPEVPTGPVMRGTTVELARFVHPFYQANAWLVMNDTHAILIDTACNDDADADRLADWILGTGRTLQAVVLSHGHPDVWLGVKRLRERFPTTAFGVASEAIVDDIVGMGQILEQARMAPPELARHPYREVLETFPDEIVLAGAPSATLRFRVTDRPTEHTRLTTIELPELGAVFVSDLAYNQVHAWAGVGVDRAAVGAWLAELDRLVERYGGTGLTVLTGHGPATDANVLYAQRAYLRQLLDTIDRTGDAAELVRSFPGHAGRDFQLAMTFRNREALGETRLQPTE